VGQEGLKPKPIYLVTMAPVAWQLLWWLIANMDQSCLIIGSWRAHAARDLGRHANWIARCGQELAANKLITLRGNPKWVRVEVGNIAG